MENHPEDTLPPGKPCPASWLALRKAQLIAVSDKSKTLHSWKIHFYSRKLLAMNNVRLALTAMPPARAAKYKRQWSKESMAQVF